MNYFTVKVIGHDRPQKNGDAPEGNNNPTSELEPTVSSGDLLEMLSRRRRLEWTKDWLKNHETTFLTDDCRNHESYILNPFFNVTDSQFHYLVSKLEPSICNYWPQRKKKAFSAEERLSIVLKFLATGECHCCLHYAFRAAKPVVLNMIANICFDIYNLLKDEFICVPNTEQDWQAIAQKMQQKTTLPKCIGSLAMRQIKFRRTYPSRPELEFMRYGALIFTAIVDNNHDFIYVDIERTSADKRVEIFEQSKIHGLIEGRKLPLPAVMEAAAGAESTSHFFVGDDELPLKPFLMNSFFNKIIQNDEDGEDDEDPSQIHYAMALAAANKHASDALQMLSNIFPIFSRPLTVPEEHAEKIMLGCVALFNYLRKTDKSFYQRSESICATRASRPVSDEWAPDPTFVESDNCFEKLVQQKGDTVPGERKKMWLARHMAQGKSSGGK